MSIISVKEATISTYDELYDLIPEDTIGLSMLDVTLASQDICDAFAECIEDLTELISLQLSEIHTPDYRPLKYMDLNRLHRLERLEINGLNIRELPDISNCTNLQNIDITAYSWIVSDSTSIPKFSIETSLDSLDWSRLHRLRYVRLAHNNISGTIPEWLGRLKNLYILDLSDNQLTGSIPASFVKHPNLGRLQLDNNQLSGGLEHLKQMQELVECNIHNNQFTGKIPPTLFKNGSKGGDNKGNFRLQGNQFDSQSLPPKLRKGIRILTNENISVPPSEKDAWYTSKIREDIYEHVKY